jgi:hypothetical protein
MESACKSSGKRKRHDLTLKEKYEVIQRADQEVSHHKIAEAFQCSESQISHIIGNRIEIERCFEENFNSKSKRLKAAPNRDINQAVWNWFQVVTGKSIPVSSNHFVKIFAVYFRINLHSFISNFFHRINYTAKSIGNSGQVEAKTRRFYCQQRVVRQME